MRSYNVIVPFVDDMGSINSFVVHTSSMRNKDEEALWVINNMRDHDGLPHLTRMPKGTKYEEIFS